MTACRLGDLRLAGADQLRHLAGDPHYSGCEGCLTPFVSSIGAFFDWAQARRL